MHIVWESTHYTSFTQPENAETLEQVEKSFWTPLYVSIVHFSTNLLARSSCWIHYTEDYKWIIRYEFLVRGYDHVALLKRLEYFHSSFCMKFCNSWQFISTYMYQFLQIYLNILSNGANFSTSTHRFAPCLVWVFTQKMKMQHTGFSETTSFFVTVYLSAVIANSR